MKTFINMLRDDSGASAAEYALILAIIGGAIALAAIALGGADSATAMNNADDLHQSSCLDATRGCLPNSNWRGRPSGGPLFPQIRSIPRLADEFINKSLRGSLNLS